MKCENCRYWSEMIARAIGHGPVEAMCLSSKSKYHSKYTSGRMGCEHALDGRDWLGAVDVPGAEQEESE